MSLPNDLPEEEFLHWVKATLGLQIAKRASSSYIKAIMTKFIHELKEIHPPHNEDHFDSLLYKVMFRGEIKLGKVKGVRSWMLYDQSCVECKEVISRILDAFNEMRDCTYWRRHCDQESFKPELHWWIVSKLYISKKCNVDNVICADETDPFAVFSVMRNCKQFEEQVKHHAGCIIALRNGLMHSSNNTLTKEEMEDSFAVIIDYLDVIRKSNSNKSQEVVADLDKALEDLDDLKKKKLSIFDKENNLQDFTKRAIQTLQQCLRTDFQIPTDSDFNIITSLISQIERKKCENEKQQLRDKLMHIKEKQDETSPGPLESPGPTEATTKPFTDAKLMKKIDMRVESEKYQISKLDICQMSDGTIIVIDKENMRLKRLDDKYNVKDFCDLKNKPKHVVAISSSEVAVLAVPNVLQFISINELDKMSVVKEIILRDGLYVYVARCMVFCNKNIWIMNDVSVNHVRIHVYSLSGELQRGFNVDIDRPDIFYPGGKFMSTNTDNTRVYVVNDDSVKTFDMNGDELFTFPINVSLGCITVTDADVLLLSDLRGNHVYMYDLRGQRPQRLGTLKLNLKRRYDLDTPHSHLLLYDKKNCCLITSDLYRGCLVYQLKK